MANLPVGTTIYEWVNNNATPSSVYTTSLDSTSSDVYDIYGTKIGEINDRVGYEVDVWFYNSEGEIDPTIGDTYERTSDDTSSTTVQPQPVSVTYISKLSNGTDTYTIKDSEARTSITNKQDILVSGTNIKTIGGTSLLGSGNIAFPTVDQTYSGTSPNAQSGIAVKSAIDAAVSSVYKPAGSVAFTNLPTPASTNLGYVYNVNNSFTTDGRFIEGAGKNYPAGTNVVIIEYEYPTTTTYYAWKKDGDAGSDKVYTTTYPPQENDTVYLGNYKTDPRQFTIYGKVISYDSTSDNFTYSIDGSSSTDTSYSRKSTDDKSLSGIGYFFDALSGFIDLNGYQTTSNLVTSVSSSSTDTQYPSAKCVYDIVGDIETLLQGI